MVEVPISSIKHDKEMSHGDWKDRNKIVFTHRQHKFLVADLMVSTKKKTLLALITEFSNIAEYKINIQNFISIK